MMFRAIWLATLLLCAACGSASDPMPRLAAETPVFRPKVMLAYEVKRENMRTISQRFQVPLALLERFNPREGQGRRPRTIYVPITNPTNLKQGKIVKLIRDVFLRPIKLGDWSAAEAAVFQTLDDWFTPGEAQSLMFPVEGYISSRFSWRWNRFHKGIDIAARVGSPILAAQDGRVAFRGWKAGFGLLVILDHREGHTYYAHCQSARVKVGQKVSRGDLIARVGATGHALGPHLHFELRDNLNQPIDPTPFLLQPCTKSIPLTAQPNRSSLGSLSWAAKGSLCQNSDI